MSNIGKDVIDVDSTEGYKSLDKESKQKYMDKMML